MTTFDNHGMRHLEPTALATTGRQRAERLQQLGWSAEPQPLPELDELVQKFADTGESPDAMVNVFSEEYQNLVGLFSRSGIDIRRVKGFDTGMCPHVYERGLALALDNVHEYPRFSGNAVVDAMGVQSYLGVPLRVTPGGDVIGTVCLIDKRPRQWGNPGIAMGYGFAREVAELLLDLKQK